MSWKTPLDLETIRLVAMGLSLLASFLGAWKLLAPFDVISILAVFVGGFPVFRETALAIRSRKITMEASMVIGALASLAVGEPFPAGVIIFFTLLSEKLESLTIDRGRSAIRKLLEGKPQTATVLRDGKEVKVRAEELRSGDLIIIKQGERIPADGLVRRGLASINQASITGESLAITKDVGATVYAGTINEEGFLEVEVTRVGEDTTFGRIVKLIEEAEQSKAPVEKLADKLAGRLIYFALFSAGLTYVLTQNVISVVSVIVVAGSCGIAAGTPLALMSSIGKLAKRGVIVKGGRYIEQLRNVDTIVFDKTGTLTLGEPRVMDVERSGDHSESEIISLAATAENHSNHPIARAIMAKSKEMSVEPIHHNECTQIVGKGVVCDTSSGTILVGNESLLIEHGVKIDPGLQNQIGEEGTLGKTSVLVAHDGELCGSICMADVPRLDSKKTVERLRAMGIEVIMLTGDNSDVAARIGRELGIDKVYASMLPEEKIEMVRSLQRDGRIVVMVGDGINDAPALAEASVGIAVSGGTDVAIETADITLMTNDLNRIVDLLEAGRRTYRTVMQNFLGTIAVDGVGMILALLGTLVPISAALIHTVSELLFMLNSARLSR